MTLSLHFKGNRNYLHSTTLFDFILGRFASTYQPMGIDFSLNRLTNRDCLFIEQGDTKPMNGILVGKYSDNNKRIEIYEREELISMRKEYPEHEISTRCKVADCVVTVPDEILGYSFCEKIVAAYKHLLTSIYGNSYGNYLFARLKIEKILEGNFQIEHRRLIGERFFEGIIKVDGQEVGLILFGAKKE